MKGREHRIPAPSPSPQILTSRCRSRVGVGFCRLQENPQSLRDFFLDIQQELHLLEASLQRTLLSLDLCQLLSQRMIAGRFASSFPCAQGIQKTFSTKAAPVTKIRGVETFTPQQTADRPGSVLAGIGLIEDLHLVLSRELSPCGSLNDLRIRDSVKTVGGGGSLSSSSRGRLPSPSSHGTGQVLFTSGSSGRWICPPGSPTAGRVTTSSYLHGSVSCREAVWMLVCLCSHCSTKESSPCLAQ